MDLTVNCKIKFKEAVFIGNYPNASYSHDRTIIGTIIKDSYGSLKGQHTFTILVEESDDSDILIGSKIRRKGRNVYPKCEILEYPENHKELADEKHNRAYNNKLKTKKNFF
jgi:hypothetical protein